MFPGGRWHIISYKATYIPRFEAVHTAYTTYHLFPVPSASSVVRSSQRGEFREAYPARDWYPISPSFNGWMIFDKGHVIFPNYFFLSFGHVKDTFYIYIYYILN